MSEHPSDLRLDALRLGSADAEATAHLEGCTRCRERAERLRDEAAEFAREHDPAALARTALARPIPMRRPYLRWAAPLAAAAAVAFVVVLAPGERAKGGGEAIELWEGETRLDGPVAPGSTIRVRFSGPPGRHLAAAWFDPNGARLDLHEGRIEGPTWVPRQLMLDAERRTERIVAAFCDAPVRAAELEALDRDGKAGCKILRREVTKR